MTNQRTPRKPDLHLKVMNKVTGQKSGRIGAAWIDRDATGNFVGLTLAVDYPNTVKASGEEVYKLFPADGGETQPW